MAYTLGLDFGTLSARAVLVDTASGREAATAVMNYPHGVMDGRLAETGAPLPPDFALQDPADYIEVLSHIVPDVLQKAGVPARDVAGLCIDFTCCTLIPLGKNGAPLCFDPAFKKEPHAYVKLWKHHAAAPYAERMTAVAKERGEAFLSRCGGALSSEWMFPKIYEVLDKAPAVYAAADSFIEAGDWLTAELTGNRVRGYTITAFKAQYDRKTGFPTEAYFNAVDARLTHVVRDKAKEPVVPAGSLVGTVTKEAAARFGLAPGTPVAACLPDGHASVAACDVTDEGDMMLVLGTSGSFYLLTRDERFVPGICGVQPDAVLPGFYMYESGLCCYGDHFAYAAERLLSAEIVKEAEARGVAPIVLLTEKAAKKEPGQSGLIALNWFNGNRNTLADSELSGLFVGMTLATAPEDYLRALFEATAFGIRVIVDNFEAHGLSVKRMIAGGGIARKNPLVMQILADVLEREIRISQTAEAPAVGSAVIAAAAAGLYPDIGSAVHALSRLDEKVYRPDPAHLPVYRRLYAEYCRLYDHFGRGGNDVMKTLRRIARGEEA